MNVIETIRKEVERRLDTIHTGLDYTAEIELKGLLSFLDTLLEEPDKSLEESAEKAYPIDISGYSVECRVGATPEPLNYHERERKAFIAGAKWKEQQMLKDTMEGVARPDDCEIWVNLVGYGYKFNDGDKVRVLVLKEEEE